MAKYTYIDTDEFNNDPFAPSVNSDSEFEQLLMEDSSIPNVRRYQMGESATGTVISISSEFVFIDLGGKNAGVLAVEEFISAGIAVPKAGEELSAFIKTDNGSEIILTRSLRRNDADDLMIRNAYERKIPVEAKVEKVIKGGFEASIGNRRCFVPLTHMDIIRINTPEDYIGKVFPFHINELKGRNIVLSRKSLLQEAKESRQALILETLEVGQSHRATITRIVDFGAFASLDGVEGLIPLSELAWKRIKKADEVVRIDEVVNVKIIKIERTPKLKIALSLKDASEDPWISQATRLSPGEVLTGIVVRFIDTGAFVSVSEGVDGFVSIGQITWEKRIAHPKDILKIDQEVSVHVLSVDLEARRLGLSIKGPMPEDMLRRISAKKAMGHSALSEEERELESQWENYKASDAKIFAAGAKNNSSVLAAAFSQAKKRK